MWSPREIIGNEISAATPAKRRQLAYALGNIGESAMRRRPRSEHAPLPSKKADPQGDRLKFW